jgi:Xaa-Pro dipeptidase
MKDMSEMMKIHGERIKKLLDLMSEKNIDHMLIPPGPNFFYLTGMETESMERLVLLIINDKEISIMGPELMKNQILSETSISNIIIWKDGDNPYKLSEKYINKSSNISIEGSLPYFHYHNIKNYLGKSVSLADDILNQMRIVKDQYEMECIKQAVIRSEKALLNCKEKLVDGITELQFSELLEARFFEEGLDAVAFPTIVGFGANAAIPHHSPDSTKLKTGDSIVIDFGGKFKGYCSDITRTFFKGPPEEKLRLIYESTREANEISRENVNDGSTYASIDKTARSLITKRGYGDLFIHRLGHGLGISVHENPYLISQNQDRVMKNSVFTIEPGIYMRGFGGVRIEDTNYFDGKKCVPFNLLSRELEVL